MPSAAARDSHSAFNSEQEELTALSELIDAFYRGEDVFEEIVKSLTQVAANRVYYDAEMPDDIRERFAALPIRYCNVDGALYSVNADGSLGKSFRQLYTPDTERATGQDAVADMATREAFRIEAGLCGSTEINLSYFMSCLEGSDRSYLHVYVKDPSSPTTVYMIPIELPNDPRLREAILVDLGKKPSQISANGESDRGIFKEGSGVTLNTITNIVTKHLEASNKPLYQDLAGKIQSQTGNFQSVLKDFEQRIRALAAPAIQAVATSSDPIRAFREQLEKLTAPPNIHKVEFTQRSRELIREARLAVDNVSSLLAHSRTMELSRSAMSDSRAVPQRRIEQSLHAVSRRESPNARISPEWNSTGSGRTQPRAERTLAGERHRTEKGSPRHLHADRFEDRSRRGNVDSTAASNRGKESPVSWRDALRSMELMKRSYDAWMYAPKIAAQSFQHARQQSVKTPEQIMSAHKTRLGGANVPHVHSHESGRSRYAATSRAGQRAMMVALRRHFFRTLRSELRTMQAAHEPSSSAMARALRVLSQRSGMNTWLIAAKMRAIDSHDSQVIRDNRTTQQRALAVRSLLRGNALSTSAPRSHGRITLRPEKLHCYSRMLALERKFVKARAGAYKNQFDRVRDEKSQGERSGTRPGVTSATPRGRAQTLAVRIRSGGADAKPVLRSGATLRVLSRRDGTDVPQLYAMQRGFVRARHSAFESLSRATRIRLRSSGQFRLVRIRVRTALQGSKTAHNRAPYVRRGANRHAEPRAPRGRSSVSRRATIRLRHGSTPARAREIRLRLGVRRQSRAVHTAVRNVRERVAAARGKNRITSRATRDVRVKSRLLVRRNTTDGASRQKVHSTAARSRQTTNMRAASNRSQLVLRARKSAQGDRVTARVKMRPARSIVRASAARSVGAGVRVIRKVTVRAQKINAARLAVRRGNSKPRLRATHIRRRSEMLLRVRAGRPSDAPRRGVIQRPLLSRADLMRKIKVQVKRRDSSELRSTLKREARNKIQFRGRAVARSALKAAASSRANLTTRARAQARQRNRPVASVRLRRSRGVRRVLQHKNVPPRRAMRSHAVVIRLSMLRHFSRRDLRRIARVLFSKVQLRMLGTRPAKAHLRRAIAAYMIAARRSTRREQFEKIPLTLRLRLQRSEASRRHTPIFKKPASTERRHAQFRPRAVIVLRRLLPFLSSAQFRNLRARKRTILSAEELLLLEQYSSLVTLCKAATMNEIEELFFDQHSIVQLLAKAESMYGDGSFAENSLVQSEREEPQSLIQPESAPNTVLNHYRAQIDDTDEAAKLRLRLEARHRGLPFEVAQAAINS